MNERTIEVDGLKFRVRIDGPEGAPWLAFSNSLLTDLRSWDDQVAVFADRYRILRYDQRGHGGSQAPPPVATFERLAADLDALMEAVGAASATVIGVSMGVGTTLALAARNPGRVDGLVLCDGPPSSPDFAHDLIEANIAKVQNEGIAVMVEPTVQRWFRPDFHRRAPQTVEKVRGMIASTSAAGYIACSRALQSYDLTAALSGLPVPPLLLCGADDGSMPDMMRPMADRAPGATMTLIDDCGHLPNIEQPSSFNRALESYFAGRGNLSR